MEIVGSDAASVQLADDGGRGLRLVGWRGFDPASAAFWDLVVPQSASTCGLALARGERVVVPDLEQAAELAESEDLVEYRRSGLRAVQSTPLVDDGRVVGMLSTHWRDPHAITAEELGAVDLLAWVVRARRPALLDWVEKSERATRQYSAGWLNRRIAARTQALEDVFRDLTGEPGSLPLRCACGREDCQEAILVPFDVYEHVRASPHRFAVARGHADDIDVVVMDGDGFELVEILPEFRNPLPSTGEPRQSSPGFATR